MSSARRSFGSGRRWSTNMNRSFARLYIKSFYSGSCCGNMRLRRYNGASCVRRKV